MNTYLGYLLTYLLILTMRIVFPTDFKRYYKQYFTSIRAASQDKNYTKSTIVQQAYVSAAVQSALTTDANTFYAPPLFFGIGLM